MIVIHQFDFSTPAPVRSASRVGVAAEDLESILDSVARAVHNARVVVEGVHPTGFVLIDQCVVAKGEHAMLRFAFDGALIEVNGEASFQNQGNGSEYRRFIG